MNQLSDRLNRLSPSATLAMSQKSSELKAQGVDVINLSVGEPDFNTPDHIKEAAKKAVDDNFSRYSPVPGYPALRNAIVAKLKNENGLDYTATQISCANGAKQSVCNTIMALVNSGDEVIVPAPYWVSYPEMVKLADGTPVIVAAGIEQDFKITPAQLETAITPKTKLVIMPFPNNPTGAVMEREDLEAVAEVLRGTDIMVLSDEIYAELNYGLRPHVSIATLPGMAERTIVVNGFSKSYAMTGWRLGYACGPEAVIKIMTKIHQSAIMSAPTTSQYAAITALKDCDGEIERMRNEYNMRRRLVVKSFNDMGLTCFEPRGAFYAFPCIKSTGLTSQEFCTRLLEEKHVAIIPGDAFGASGEGYCRVSYAYSVEHLMEALRRIREFLSENGK